VIGVVAFAGSARAQEPAAAPASIPVGDWQLYPSLEVRTRGELRTDSPTLAPSVTGQPGLKDAYGVLERTRIGLGGEYGGTHGDPGLLRVQVTLQDARAWGSPGSSAILGVGDSAAATTGLYEGYIEARTTSARPAFLRIGRQAITWGDGRLLSNADWSLTARTLDAVRGHASAGIFDFEVLAAILQTSSWLGPGVGQLTTGFDGGMQIFGAQAAASIDPLFRVELSALARLGLPNVSQSLQLGVGSLRVFGDAQGWRYAAEGAYELQQPSNGLRTQWAAAGAAYVQKTLEDVVLSPMLRVEGEYATGQDEEGNLWRAAFDPVLPDVHQLGAMDLFAWSNTVQIAARASVAPSSDTSVAVEYRYVRAESGGPWVDGYLEQLSHGASQDLGQELDLWATWRPWPVLDLALGYSVLDLTQNGQGALSRGPIVIDPPGLPGGTAQQPPPQYYTAPVATFGYLQATVRVP
jgi:hypothetical protein